MNGTHYDRELALIGGGHAHVQVVKKIGMGYGVPGVRVTLISDQAAAYYSGMLPGCLAEVYTPDEIAMELRPLTRWAGVRFIQATVTGIDPRLQQIVFADRPACGYDALSINVGSVSRGMDTPGVRQHAVATRPLGQLLDRIHAFEAAFRPAGDPPKVIVVGAGAAGVELALAMQIRWQRRYGAADIALIDGQTNLLTGHHPRVQAAIRRRLDARNVRYYGAVRAEAVEAGAIRLSDGATHPYDLLLWATGGAPPEFLDNTGLDTQAGFLTVLPTLQTTGFPNIFAVGDCVHFIDRPLPKAGVYAVRQGPVLAENLRRFLTGEPLKPYRPQRAFLSLLLTGDREATASWGRWSPSGPYVWRLKNWIDRRWMSKFDPALLPVMRPRRSGAARSPASSMRCAGCGAKVGSTILTAVLDAMPGATNPRVVLGLDLADDAAILRFPAGALVAQTVDGFRAFIDDLYVFGRIAFVHAVSDVYAMGGRPDSALVMVTLPFAARHIVADDLRQLMGGVADEATRLGVALVGGHTGEGAEPSIGIVVNGLLDGRPFTKGGLVPGDCLILTKPLGVGVVLAADMNGRSRGAWVDAAISSMVQTNALAADILRDSGATAVTDVTGFGLGGHLAEMLEAGDVGAELTASALPALPGAETCLRQGMRSTLAPANREHLEKRWRIEHTGASDDEILFDPQTSGGLLAGVSEERAADTVAALRRAGYEYAAIIGCVTGNRRTILLNGGGG